MFEKHTDALRDLSALPAEIERQMRAAHNAMGKRVDDLNRVLYNQVEDLSCRIQQHNNEREGFAKSVSATLVALSNRIAAVEAGVLTLSPIPETRGDCAGAHHAADQEQAQRDAIDAARWREVCNHPGDWHIVGRINDTWEHGILAALEHLCDRARINRAAEAEKRFVERRARSRDTQKA